MSASPRPQQRTANTCVTCRARKVRCDGRRGICTNCERLSFACSYDENVAIEVVDSTSTTTISVPRRRVRSACLNCHAKKSKCSGQTPKCDRCRVLGLECVYRRPGKRPIGANAGETSSQDYNRHSPRESTPATPDHTQGSFDHVIPTQSAGSPVSSGLEQSCPDDSFDALALRAFDNFFHHIHHIPMFSFLHRASLMERYHAGLLDRALLLALIGVTALFTDLGPGTKEFGIRCIDEAAGLVMRDFEKPSVLRLQALVLITKHRILSRRFSSAFMLHATACRFAAVLRINHENPAICFLAQESRRRLMWSLYMLDTGISSGQLDFALWPNPEHQIDVQLPCNERHFEFDLPEPTEPLKLPPPGPDGVLPALPDVVGFLALHVRIHWIRSKILQFTTNILSQPSAEALARLPSRRAELAAELDAFAVRLPFSFRWSESNLRLRAYSPRLGIFIMTHVWWQQCHCDLYRLWISGLRDALPEPLINQMNADFVSHCRRQGYDHARTMADMFAQLLALGNDLPVSDLDLPVCAYQCAKLLYHGFKTSAVELAMTTESVHELAMVCLRVVKQSTAGPAAASIQADLEKLIADGLSPISTQRIPPVPVGMSPPMLVPTVMNTIESPARPLLGGGGSTGLASLDHRGSSPLSGNDPALMSAHSGAASVATHVTAGSNAFEGALDGLDFDLDLFGMDFAMSSSNELLMNPSPGYTQMDM